MGHIYSAKTVAKAILLNAASRNIEISNLKLQKLLYYAQGWRLAIFEQPLFPEAIEAWVHGPVVPEVFREYKVHRWSSLPKPEGHAANGYLKTWCDAILNTYGQFEAKELELRTHCETPWIAARTGLDPETPSHNVITHVSMRKFFKGQLSKADGKKA